jgi:hypothetical protein
MDVFHVLQIVKDSALTISAVYEPLITINVRRIMNSEQWENVRVEQNCWGFYEKPVTISTEGLGPCIGVCIAWGQSAAIVHSADVFADEEEEIAQLIERMTSTIKDNNLASVRPVVCGGDTRDDSGFSENPMEHEKEVLNCRKRIITILKKAGFGEPLVRWNESGETVDLVADLERGIVSIFIHGSADELARWSVSSELNLPSKQERNQKPHRKPRRRS